MPPKVVVVTGASTGIGRACALDLAARGLHVVAGVRREEDGAALQRDATGSLTPVRIDVTDVTTLAVAAETTAAIAGDAGLAGIVCNAGIAVASAVEFVPLDALRHQLEVNVTGQVATVQAFLPKLRASRGRIVLMSSMGGRLGQPFMAPYCASKFALEAIGDALRIELHPWGIEVALVEPGAVATPIWEKSLAAAGILAAGLPDRAEALYGRAVATMRELAAHSGTTGVPAERVAEAVAHALTAPRPRTRYPVGREARIGMLASRLLPDRLRDAAILRLTGLPR